MKCIIAGPRKMTVTMNELDNITSECPFFEKVNEIVSGGAIGIDRCGEEWARSRNYQLRIMLPEWDRLGKSAAFRRNDQMAQYADVLIAIWNGESKGTKHMIDTMTKLKKHVFVVLTKYTAWESYTINC